MSFPHPFKSSDSAAHNTFPAAYRAWAHWVSVVGYGGLQVAQIRDGAPDEQTARPMLCEVYARAVMETVMAQVFDRADSRADVAVFMLMEELYGTDLACDVVNSVHAGGGSELAPRGVLVRTLFQTLTIRDAVDGGTVAVDVDAPPVTRVD